MNAASVVENLKQRFPNEPEYIQAVSQVLGLLRKSTTNILSLISRTSLSVSASLIDWCNSASHG